MKDVFKGLGILAVLVIIIMGLSLAFGWFDVGYTKTVGKAKQNAETEVFYETQAFVDAKNQEAAKLYREYMRGDEDDKEIIMNQASHTFSSVKVDEIIRDDDIKTFINNCIKGVHTKSPSDSSIF